MSDLNKGKFKEMAIEEMERHKDNYKSEADMKNNLFKSEPDALIQEGGFEIRVGGGADYSQPIRKGFAGNARDRLEQTLFKAQHAPVKMDATMKNAIKGEDTGLKNTHGEQFHTDNDKMVEQHVSNVDVIDRDHEVDKKDRTSTPKRKDSLVDAGFKSLTQEELFLKSFTKQDKAEILASKKEYENDIERSLDSLIMMLPDQNDPNVIANIHENDDSIRSKRREPELVMRSENAVGRKIKKLKDEGKPQKQAVAIALDMERRGDISKSELDELVDIIKGGKDRCWEGYKPTPGKKPYEEGSCTKKADVDFDGDGKLDPHEKHHKKMEKLADVEEKEHAKKGGPGSGPQTAGGYRAYGADKPMGLQGVPNRPKKYVDIKSVNPFVKSYGPGGIIMNFGATTGNPIADNFSRHLNAFAEPIQEQTARDQAAAYEKALEGYVEKGEQKFMADRHGYTDGGVNHGWAEQMSKPMDQQVVEAYKSGNLGKGEENPLLRSIQKSQQASIPQGQHFNPQAVQSVVAGQQISAQSETDAAVMEMYNSMMKSQEAAPGEFVADTKGISIVAGDPLPPELDQFKIAE